MWICLFTLQIHSCIFEADSYICSGMHRLEQHQWNCSRLALHPVGVPWTFESPRLTVHLYTSPPHSPISGVIPVTSVTFEKTDVNLILPRLCLGDTPKLTADSEVPQRHLSWFRVTSESVLSHSDPVKESAEMNWWRMAYLYPGHLIAHSPTGQEY